MKEKELRELSTCISCSEKIGEKPIPMFWKVTTERHLLDTQAVSRQQGLTMMMGGNAELAYHMGANEEMTHKMSETKTVMICDQCVIDKIPQLMM